MGIEGNCDFRDCYRQSSSPIYDGNNYSSERSAASTVWSETTDYDHGNPGILQFQKSRVVLSSTGTATVIVERVGGYSGAVSCTVKTNSTTGDMAMTSGVHFTAVSQVVSFSDQEAGAKSVDITVGTSPGAGLHYIEVTMDTPTGSVRLRNPNMQVYFDDGGVNTSATTFTASDAATLEATINAGGAGSLYYFRDTAGVYTYNNRASGRDWGGYTISVTSTATSRTMIANYPGESPVVDQNYNETSDSLGQRTTVGFLIDGSDFLTIKGIEITETLFSGIYTENSSEGNIVEDCYFHDIANPADANAAYNGNLTRADNIGAIGLDNSTRSVMRYNTIEKIYDPRPGTGLTNPFDAVLYSLHSGIHGFSLIEPWIHNNTISQVEKGVFQKNPNQIGSEFGHRVHDNKFSKIGASSGTAASCFASQVAGSGQQGAQDNYFYNNLCDLSDAGCANTDGWQVIQFQSDTTTQSDNFWAFNNTIYDGRRAFNIGDVTDVVLYSNVIDNLDTTLSMNGNSAGGVTVNNVEYCDFNRIVQKFIMQEDAVGESEYLTLAAWQGAFGGGETQLERATGTNSIATAPTYVSLGTGDYRTTTGATVGTGRFSRDIGIGSLVVGA